MDFTNQKVLVIGMGKSGIAAATALNQRGAQVTLCDRQNHSLSMDLSVLTNQGIEVFPGGYPDGQWDLVIVSPGVPLTEEPIEKALNHQIPVWGELELAFRLKSAEVSIAAITGTNGKTTTTALLGEILTAQGIPASVAGNIGIPMVSIIEKMNSGWIACEVSSFQLETTQLFKPRVASIINITPDHLDRHHTMEEYIKAKARIFNCMEANDTLILNYDDELVRRLADQTRSQVVFCSQREQVPGGVYYKNGSIFADYQNIGAVIPFADTRLRGEHNLENVLVAVAMALAIGIDLAVIRSTLRSFSGVRHRLEEVAAKRGVLYINDSKGTNPDSTIKALQAFSDPIVLIAGGRHKGGDLTELAHLIKEQVRVLVLLGEAKNIIKDKMIAIGYHSIIETDSLEEAVTVANKASRPGEVVLLSPACASWDMFKNYEQRGDLFCSLVAQLPD